MSSISVWATLNKEASEVIKTEPLLASYVYACVLNHPNFEASLSFILSNKIADNVMPAMAIRELFENAYKRCPDVINNAKHDLRAVFERDPAIDSMLTILLNLKGYLAIQSHRLAHCLWDDNRKELAMFIQSRNSEVFGVDIHPASRIGKGVMFDHATGIVVGETAVIGDNVSIMQQVTLGGTGNETGDRHPKICSGVLVGAGAIILGNVKVGRGAKVGAGSVVLTDVAPHTTVAGVPSKVVGKPNCDNPAHSMQQNDFADCFGKD
ncbi:serine O-acetyltransferase [Leucothrix arctica]|uniref:Serine acetyltransferase n=1 Tax=Leucothrix arctica TaxID=1481894 RepID=A0A317CCV8_9GAMM|nr:serine O-acetyltransferase [Leucothrix arctica]PWQ95951.1 serine O-acetyltransferase [Leucothrix arctica]